MFFFFIILEFFLNFFALKLKDLYKILNLEKVLMNLKKFTLIFAIKFVLNKRCVDWKLQLEITI